MTLDLGHTLDPRAISQAGEYQLIVRLTRERAENSDRRRVSILLHRSCASGTTFFEVRSRRCWGPK